MAAKRNVITEAVADWAKARGFRRKSSTYSLRRAETIAVVHLQRFTFGPRYFVNVALWFLEVEDVDHPKEHQCHLRARLGSLLPTRSDDIPVFDLEYGIPDDERRRAIVDLLDARVLPALLPWDSIETGLASSEGRKMLDQWVHRDAYPVLGWTIGERPSEEQVDVLKRSDALRQTR